jgi:hypothetical protein
VGIRPKALTFEIILANQYDHLGSICIATCEVQVQEHHRYY